MNTKAYVGITVADQVFIATALLHREQPEREDFTISEIVARVAEENARGNLGEARQNTARVHASSHCVANRPPNPGSHRMLYATGLHTRRLLRAGDDVHPGRTGKIWPDPDAVPERYRDLIDWAKQRFGREKPRRVKWLASIISLRGSGSHIWGGEDPDDYVRSLRENW